MVDKVADTEAPDIVVAVPDIEVGERVPVLAGGLELEQALAAIKE